MSNESQRELRELDRSEKYADKYMRMRTIKAEEKYETMIGEVGILKNGNFGMTLAAAGEEFLVELPTDSLIDEWDNLELRSLLSEFPIELNPPVTLSDLEGVSFDVYFDEDMEYISVDGTNYDIPIEHLDDRNLSFKSDGLEQLEEEISLCIEYYDSEPTDTDGDGFRCAVSDVREIDEESFEVTVTTVSGVELEWELDVPLSTEPSASETARLVEEVGHGDPRHINGENVVLIHKTHADTYLESVGTDRTRDWYLVTPSAFEEWDDIRESNKQNNTGNDGRDPSTRTDALLYGFSTPIIAYMSKTMIEIMFFDTMTSSEVARIQSSELFALTMSIVDLLAVMGPIFGVVAWVVLTISEDESS